MCYEYFGLCAILSWWRCFYLQQLNKRKVTRSNSFFDYLWGDWSGDDAKAKNIKQTELLVDLRAAILQIGRHFQSLDPDNDHIVSDLYL